MADAVDSTRSSARPLLPLAPFVFRPSPPVDDLRSAEELLEEIGREIERQVGADRPEMPPEPLLPAADAARTLHLRRQLAAAVEHGTDLLAALGLPRLVGPDTIVIDPEAAGDALALAIDTLDVLDAPGEDLEDDEREIPEDDELSLGWREAVSQLNLGQASDDGEHTLGAPERHPSVPMFSHYFRCHEASQASWAQGARQDGEGEAEAGYDLPCDEDELDGDGSTDGEAGEPSIGWPNDYTAVLSDALQADHDPEADDADLEEDGPRAVVHRPLGLHEPSARDLVARAKALRCGKAAPSVLPASPWIDAPRVFGLHVEGDCCAPEILSHSSVHVDKEATPQAGDFVALWFEAERAGRPVMVGWVKRLVLGLPDGLRWPHVRQPGDDVEPVLMVESLNPPRCYRIDARKVHAVFKVVAVIPPAEAIAARQAWKSVRLARG